MTKFLTELNKLKHLQQHLEKNEKSIVEHMPKSEQAMELINLQKHSHNLRTKQRENLENDVKHIIQPLKKITSLVKSKKIQNMDVELIQKDLTQVQNNIQNLKLNTKCSIDILEEEELKLLEDIEAVEQKIHTWKTKNKINHPIKARALKKTITAPENITEEAKNFIEFVTESGGHENGWLIEDHNIFLKARLKTKTLNRLVEALTTIMPDKSSQEITAHEEWYQKYLELKEKHKNSIKEWRLKKKIQVRNQTHSIKTETEYNRYYNECIDKEKTQQKIAAWKAEKINRLQTQFSIDAENKIKQEEAAEKQRERHKQIKQQVHNWRTVKNVEKETKTLKKQMQDLQEQKDRSSKANKLLKQFRSNDELIIQQKLKLRVGRPKSAEELRRSSLKAPRDPARLFKPTKQWILRSFDNETERNHASTLNLQTIPKLGVPEWRRCI